MEGWRRKGGFYIRLIFWNIYKKNLLLPIIQLIQENNIDAIALVEIEKLDISAILDELDRKNMTWKRVEILEDKNICLLAKNNFRVFPFKEEKHYHIYKITLENESWLFHVLHLSSAMHLEENARDRRAERISRVLQKEEEDFFQQESYKSIIVGDFNLQPYSDGIMGVQSFNATMSAGKAKKVTRKHDGEDYHFYFNPMWKLMGDNKTVQGTYYSTVDSQDKSVYWYTFDQVLLRPYFIEKFQWNSFEIIEGTKEFHFIKDESIDKEKYSDHLPLLFEIEGDM